MLLSSDQQALLRTWFFQAQKIHKRRRRYDVPNLPSRCGLEDARWLCGVLKRVFQALSERDGTDPEADLAPYLHFVGCWVRACSNHPGSIWRHTRAWDLLTAALAFVHTLGSLEVQSYNRSNPMNDRLPVDIFILIFELLGFKNRLVVSHVCHYWRQIALACPSLWTTLELYENGFGRDVCLGPHQLSQLIQRSNAAPLSLFLSDIRMQSMDALSACLSAGLHRMQRLSITFSSNVLFSDSWLNAMRQPAPILEYLRLATGKRMHWERAPNPMIPLPHDLFMGHAPRLQGVYLGTLNLPRSCPAFAQVRSFAGHFVAGSRTRSLAQDRQTRLVYQLCPRLETLDLCYISGDGEVLPPPPTGHALKSVIMNSAMAKRPGDLAAGIHRAVSGMGDLSYAQFARAIGGDTCAIMRLWCDPLPSWWTVTIEEVRLPVPGVSRPIAPSITISAICGISAASDLQTREFVLAASYLRHDRYLIAQLKARMASARACTIDPRIFKHCRSINILKDATALESLHIVLDDEAKHTLGLFAGSEIVLRLPSLKTLKFCAPSDHDWARTDRPRERTVQIQAEDLAAFLRKHVKAPNLESLVLARDLKVYNAGEIAHGLTSFVAAVVVE